MLELSISYLKFEGPQAQINTSTCITKFYICSEFICLQMNLLFVIFHVPIKSQRYLITQILLDNCCFAHAEVLASQVWLYVLI